MDYVVNVHATKKALAAFIALVFTVSLCPSVAFASLSAGTVETQGEKTVSVKVLSKTVLTGTSTKESCKYSYDKNGMLTKLAGDNITGKYTYTGTKVKKYVEDQGSNRRTVALSYDKKGRVSKQSEKHQMSYGSYAYVYAYKYDSKNRVKSSTKKWEDGTSTSSKYAYDGKNRIKKVAIKEGTNDVAVKLNYNKNGDLTEYYYDSRLGYDQYYNYKYAYKNGDASKCSIETYRHGSYTKTFAYKTISVPKSMAAKVKHQQWELVNTLAITTNQYPAALSI